MLLIAPLTELLLMMRAHHRALLLGGVLAARIIPQRIPIDDIPRQLHVIVRELADLGVVHAQHLGFLRGAQLQTGDQVHDEEDEAGAAEGVGEAADGVGELVGQLDPVAVEPAAGDGGEAVEVGDVVAVHAKKGLARHLRRNWGVTVGVDLRSKEAGAEIADQTADSMDGKDVERVIDAEEKLQLGGVVAC